MNKVSKVILSGFIVSGVFLNGCSAHTTQAAVSKQPQIVNKQIKSSENLKDIANRFIPQGAKILEEDRIVGNESIYKLDVDNDDIDEVVVFFKNKEKFENGFFVLKKNNNKWIKIFEDKSQANAISMVQLVNVYDSTKKSLILGKLISTRAGSEYTVYNFKKDKFEKLELGLWNKFQILNNSLNDDKGIVFGGWLNQGANIYSVDVIRFNREKFTCAEKEYPVYFENCIDNNPKYFGREHLKEFKFAWYYFIDMQIKANRAKEALESIEKVFQINKNKDGIYEIEDYKFYLLKAKALNELEEYKKAEDILLGISKEITKIIDTNREKIINDNDFYYMDMQKELSDMYFELGRSYLEQKNKNKAKEKFNISLELLKELLKEGYFLQDTILDINREVTFNRVEDELNKLKD
ncbi:hypothetical protein OW763_02560 [Clostridium aestuarii]|uniref:Lipoprotein n=1 Tax=Clostridium aestuarii TaxID=338193 RepID=A0ABT4CWN7_9CLOT|nr:hypothetical protein [Clostridium aestuarii]MCY6483237.1 hypothetical protein [Clostridium aestuarii]